MKPDGSDLTEEQKGNRTGSYGFFRPTSGATSWGTPLNRNFEAIDSALDDIDQNSGSGQARSVRHAIDFSGANGAEMIRAAIDDIPDGEWGTVVIGGEGPDSPSAAPQENVWQMVPQGTAPKNEKEHHVISIPSKTTLVNYGYLWQDTAENSPKTDHPTATFFVNEEIIANQGSEIVEDEHRDEHIYIFNFGTCDLNNNRDNHDDPNSQGVDFWGVDHAAVLGGVWKNSESFMFRPCDVNWTTFGDCLIWNRGSQSQGNRDGYHLIGGRNNTVQNMHGYVGDDAVVLDNGDGSAPIDAAQDIRHFTAHNIHFRQNDAGGYSNADFFKSICSPGQVIEDVKFSNFSMQDVSGPLIGLDSTGRSDGPRAQRNFKFSNGWHNSRSTLAIEGGASDVVVESVTGKNINGHGVSVNAETWSLKVDNCYYEGKNGGEPLIKIADTLLDADISASCRRDPSQQSAPTGIGFTSGARVAHSEFDVSYFALDSGITIDSGATVQNVRFNPTFRDVFSNRYNDEGDNGTLGTSTGVLIHGRSPGSDAGQPTYAGTGAENGQSITLGFRPSRAVVWNGTDAFEARGDSLPPQYSRDSNLTLAESGFEVTGSNLNAQGTTYTAYYEA